MGQDPSVSNKGTGGARKWLKWLGAAVGVLVALYVALLIPEGQPPEPDAAKGEPFVWGQDHVWDQLEARFIEVREAGCEATAKERADGLKALRNSINSLQERRAEVAPDDPLFATLEGQFFEASASAAACPAQGARELLDAYAAMRQALKDASTRWSIDARPGRDRLYRLLYGGRMATEEVLLQMPPEKMPVVVKGEPAESDAPSVEIRGVRVHSGDMLLSRGGAPTSALIARGNDYPGNFSHVALVHVDDKGHFQTVEAHIESGVVVAGLDKYAGDPKLRIMLLRPRAGLADTHKAATKALNEATGRHIEYDFAMDYNQPERMFCSEVASWAYKSQGVSLWKGLTTMSSPTTARWLSAFGVRNFTTHGPSDLEYDPQLTVIAEWRDPETLFKDHIDDAIIDAMLEHDATAGRGVQYSTFMLPVARIAKGISQIQNAMGSPGIIPEGMSATTALRAEWLRKRHDALKTSVMKDVAAFEAKHNYKPPYWRLVAMSKEAVAKAN